MNINLAKIRANRQQGFTIVEILVALLLMTIIFSLVIGVSFDSRKDLQESVNNIERAIRYSGDEASLKNVICRIHFLLEKSPQEFFIELGPDDNFVLPTKDMDLVDQTSLSLEDQKKYEKVLTNINKKFSKLKEFEEENKKIAENIRIIGIGSTLHKNLLTAFESSIYFYPTGEKDGAIIILGSDEEVVSIEVAPFINEIDVNFLPIEFSETSTDDLEELQMSMAQKIFNKWIKN